MEYNFISTSFTIDRKLYKYYSNAEYAVSSIKNRCIHLDNPRDFNDPFEAAFCCSYYSQLITPEYRNKTIAKVHELIAYIVQKKPSIMHRNMMDQMMQYLLHTNIEKETGIFPIAETIKYLYQHFSITDFSFIDFCHAIDQGFLSTDPFLHIDCKMSCFSEVNDSILMWSYYANCHQGVCIEYDLSQLDPLNHLNQEILQHLSKVHYSPIRADNLLERDDTSFLNFLTSKADVWAHEHEWRIICNTEEEFLPLDCISAIYLGANFNLNAQKYQNIIKAANTYDSLKIYKCKLNSEKFQIDFDEIYDTSINVLLTTKKGQSKRKTSKKLAVSI